MTSAPEMTVEELTRKIQTIKNLGWVRTARKGPTGVGHTLEALLGYAENNIAIPDWGVFEIKATRKSQRNLVTLFSKVPKRVEGIDPRTLVTEHGYWDSKKGRQSLYCTVSATETNSLGWRILIYDQRGRIEFVHNGEIVAYEELASLQDVLTRKVENLVLVLAERKVDGKIEFFHYNEAYLLARADAGRLLNLLRRGKIVFDWRMHIKPDGRVRDHGPGYRMFETDIPQLYAHTERLV
ncbi:MAG: MvaI/BcnI family restriction endonuclease [Candidatus Thorarchaeota archaeon]